MHYPQNSQNAKSAPSANGLTSLNWSGVVATSLGPIFDAVAGYWHVPPSSLPPIANDGTYATSSLWVGIDGHSSFTNDIIQCGTQQATVYHIGGAHGTPYSVTSYTPWVEYFPTDVQNVSMNVAAEDYIYAQAWRGDSNGMIDGEYGPYGWFYIYDETRGTYYTGSIAQPSDTAFWGVNAEWIMERGPSNPPSFPPLEDFGVAEMDAPAADTVGQNWQLMRSFNIATINMIDSANNLLAGGVAYSDAVGYTWYAAQ